jgi:hypothetical protein
MFIVFILCALLSAQQLWKLLSIFIEIVEILVGFGFGIFEIIWEYLF